MFVFKYIFKEEINLDGPQFLVFSMLKQANYITIRAFSNVQGEAYLGRLKSIY